MPALAQCLLACVVALTFFGCNAVPPSARVTPRTGDILTRTNSGNELQAANFTPEIETKPKLAFDSLDEISPLPPALQQKVENLDDIPPDVTVAPRAVELPRPKSDPLIRLASATFDEVAKSAPPVVVTPVPKPQPVATTPPPAATPLAEVKKEPAPTPAPVPEPVKKTPEDVWREGVQSLRAVARDRLQSPSAITGPNWLVRERILGWLAEPDIDPDARTSDDIAQGRSVLKGLAAVLDAKTPNRGEEIRKAIETLEAQAPLEITDLKLVRQVRGFGDIEPLEPPARKAGQAVVLYCELAGLAYEPMSAGYRSRVSAEVELLPEGSGDTPMWKHTLGTAEDPCRKHRRDYFVGHRFTLPDSITPGKYRLRLTEKDLVSDHVATKETVINIIK